LIVGIDTFAAAANAPADLITAALGLHVRIPISAENSRENDWSSIRAMPFTPLASPTGAKIN
jgi:hypothetical protein